jgi:hypothetical protein
MENTNSWDRYKTLEFLSDRQNGPGTKGTDYLPEFFDLGILPNILFTKGQKELSAFKSFSAVVSAGIINRSDMNLVLGDFFVSDPNTCVTVGVDGAQNKHRKKYDSVPGLIFRADCSIEPRQSQLSAISAAGILKGQFESDLKYATIPAVIYSTPRRMYLFMSTFWTVFIDDEDTLNTIMTNETNDHKENLAAGGMRAQNSLALFLRRKELVGFKNDSATGSSFQRIREIGS